jgi:hypothetical protein
MPEEDLAFLRAYSDAQGTSAEAFLARHAHNLRRHLELPVEAPVKAATGIVSPAVDAGEAHREQFDKKHRSSRTLSRASNLAG